MNDALKKQLHSLPPTIPKGFQVIELLYNPTASFGIGSSVCASYDMFWGEIHRGRRKCDQLDSNPNFTVFQFLTVKVVLFHFPNWWWNAWNIDWFNHLLLGVEKWKFRAPREFLVHLKEHSSNNFGDFSSSSSSLVSNTVLGWQTWVPPTITSPCSTHCWWYPKGLELMGNSQGNLGSEPQQGEEEREPLLSCYDALQLLA